MKHILTLSLILLLPVMMVAQKWPGYKDPQNMKVTMDREAYFPLGDEYLYEYFFYKLRYDQKAIDDELIGEVLLSFVVNTDSTISDIFIINSVGYGVDEQVIRILKPLKYVPATLNGLIVKSNLIMSVPIRAVAWEESWERDFNF
ncbi:energy transducer TonB [Bacteroidota bacterium]